MKDVYERNLRRHLLMNDSGYDLLRVYDIAN